MGIVYNYTISKPTAATQREYEWYFSEWSACSVSCGSGHQMSFPVCKERTFGIVDDGKCEPDKKPDKKMRVCNTQHCPTRWWTGPWQLCPATCGEYPKILRKRTVLCIEQIDQEPVVYTQPPNFRHHGGIEYLESERRKKKSLKQCLEEELNKDEKTLKEFLEEEIMALPDVQCKGQEKPSEQEPCPNLPPCGTADQEKNNLKSDGVSASVRFENGFTESEINCTEVTSDASRNATSCEWLKTLEKKGKKIRHELRKSNETLKIIYGNLNNRDNSRKTFNNRRNKKVKKKKKDKTKKNYRGTGEIEELSSPSSPDFKTRSKMIYANKSNSNDYESIDKSIPKTIPITNYLYYKSPRKNRRQTFLLQP